MKTNGERIVWVVIVAICAVVAGNVQATVLPGSSSLIGTLDYSDTFTVGTGPRPDGLYDDNTGGGYNVENTYGNPVTTWLPTGNFSFNSGGGTTVGSYPGNTGNTGAASGLAQSGGGSFSFFVNGNLTSASDYVVQADALMPTSGDGRLYLYSAAVGGDQPSSVGALGVSFTRTGGAGIELHHNAGSGPVITSTGFDTGIASADTTWHNFAVRFSPGANSLAIYVDQSLKGTVDLATFAGGFYQTYSSTAVGAGVGALGWVDNFQVGDFAAPEPGTIVLLGIGGWLLWGRSRKTD